MKLPWVSREFHETLTAEKDRQIARLEAELAARDQKEAEVTAKVQTIQRQRSKLTQAIRQQARQPDGTLDSRLANYLRDQANAMLREVPEVTDKVIEDVIQRISTWDDTETANRLTAEAMVRAHGELH